jgi:hypothetical protein
MFSNRGLLVGLVLVLFARSGAARDLYVATTGSDQNTGTLEAPYRTIAKAADAARAGDTVYIRAGTYNERLVPKASGTSSSKLVFMGYPGEPKPVLNGQGQEPPGVVYVNGRQHVDIVGLEVRNAVDAGIWIIDSSYITISGNRTYNTVSSGIIVSEFGTNHHIYIDGNEVELCCNDGGQECISVSKCDTFEVTKNHVHHGGPGTHGGEGIDIKFGSKNGIVAYNHVHHLSRQGLYADAWTIDTRNVAFYGNVVHDCAFGAGVASEQGGGLYDITFHNNLIYDTKGPGLYVLMSAGPLERIQFVNNTVHATGTEWGSGLWLNGENARDIVVRNNVFSGNNAAPFLVSKAPLSITVDSNLAPVAQPGYASGFILGDAKYVNAAAADFRLASGSPAIDSGSSSTVYDVVLGDLEGKPRVLDGNCDGTAAIDMGAYEHAASCNGTGGDSVGGTSGTGGAGTGGSGGTGANPVDPSTGGQAAGAPPAAGAPSDGFSESTTGGGCGCFALGQKHAPLSSSACWLFALVVALRRSQRVS